MQFSSIPTLIDAHVLSLLNDKPIKGASLFLYVASKSPLVLEDSNKVRLIASQDDLVTYFQSYDKISQDTNICLENVEIHLQFTSKGRTLQKVELSSKQVITDVGAKQNKLKNFELRVNLERKGGELPLAISTGNYLRRMERQELVKKHYKPSKVDLLNFVKHQKAVAASDSFVSHDVTSLDSESVGLLRKLLQFTDKEELFKVLLKKPLREKHSKKAVRLSIIPTDVESDSETFDIKKKKFTRNTIIELLSEYEAREDRMRE